MDGAESIAMVSTAATHDELPLLTFSIVCQHDAACKGFPLWGLPPDWDDDDAAEQNMTCYTGGETVFSNHQMCDVTSMLNMPKRTP